MYFGDMASKRKRKPTITANNKAIMTAPENKQAATGRKRRRLAASSPEGNK
jgi:hypothetical protein